jgi:signal transduction histidine kinase
MRTHRLFSKSRWRLTWLYAGVIGVVVFLTQLSMHSSLWVVQTQGFDYAIEQLTGTIHDYLVAQLEQPGVVQAETRNVLTGAGVSHINLLGIVRQKEYYIRLVDLQGRIIATSTFQPEGLSETTLNERWQTLTATDGTHYRQISEHLHTRDGQIWGYLQLGRSTQELEEHQRHLNLILAISVPVSMLVVGGVGYWLAGFAMRPIYRSYQQMEQFTSDAAHELRTPLTTTRTLVQTTLNKVRAGKWIDIEPLEAIERQNDRLTRLVADLLWLARTDGVGKSTRFQPCCLNDLISDLVEELAPMAQSASVDLTAHFASHSLVYVLGNEEQLYRLLSNLMVNGMQYTPAGGKVDVYLRQTHASAVVEVEDTGIGISTQAQKKIFDRFYRADTSRSRHTGGTGLGLSICMAIVQLHRGTIQVKSQLGQGSTFTVMLPKYTLA